MSGISTYQRVRQITQKLTSTTAGSLVDLMPSFTPDILPGLTVLSVNNFVKSLRAYARITSLPEITLPNFELTDSETDKLYKSLDVEWTSPRKQLDLLISQGSTWEVIGSVSLLNPSGYPYRSYNLQDLFTDNLAVELGENGKIGVQLKDVGTGLLTGTDTLTIYGSYSQEIIVSANSLLSECFDDNVSINNTSTLVLPANNNRQYLSLTNIGENPCFLNLGISATIDAGIKLNPDGNFEMTPSSGLWRGQISAISPSTTILSILECE
ncbi:hypothetical protein [Calothrix sp. 336/3]|uniref:hypothetical protein n=1 Tax=Calothrix sp. 336/3 TaxID=1337936 RepID=UPI0004E317DA|nr:hypothetical protein [Calothrix sp. 336/3]AKG21245.1 hypothetical protein IJ00_07995 [Calothrix sp. 336/3]